MSCEKPGRYPLYIGCTVAQPIRDQETSPEPLPETIVNQSSFKKSGTNRQKTDTKKAVYIYVTKNVAGTIKAIMNIVKVLPAIR